MTPSRFPAEAGAAPAVREAFAALAVFLAGALLYLGPAMHWRLGDSLGPDHGDPLLYVYLLKWFAHSFAMGFAGYWNPPFFHPLEGVLAFSDHLIGPGAAFTVLRAIGAPTLAAYNFLYACQFVAAGWALWWVLRFAGASFAAAAVGGWYFAFGHFRWDEQSHFNVLLIAAVPLVLWSFDRLLEAPTGGRAALFVTCYVVHLSGGTYLAYLVHVPLAILFVLRARSLSELVRREPRRLRPLAAAAALAALPLAFLYFGYSTRAPELQAERNLRELRESSSVLSSFVSASDGSPLDRFANWLPTTRSRGSLFPGFAVSALAAAALVTGWRRLRRPVVHSSPVAWAVAGLGVTLALAGLVAGDRFTTDGGRTWGGIELHGYRGPLYAALVGAALVVIAQRRLRDGPLADWSRIAPRTKSLLCSSGLSLLFCLPTFYWLLWSSLPGMKGTRVSHRFYAFAAVGVALCAARGFDILRRSVAHRALRVALAAALMAAVAIECAPRLRAWRPLADEQRFPGFAGYLARAPDVAAYLQLPILGDWRDLRTMYFGTAHWVPMVNGSTSFEPRHYPRLARDCSDLQPRCFVFLRRYGVSHLVVLDPDRNRGYDRAESMFRRAQRAVRRELAKGTLEPVFDDESGSVYRLFARSRDRDSRPANLTPSETTPTLEKTGGAARERSSSPSSSRPR